MVIRHTLRESAPPRNAKIGKVPVDAAAQVDTYAGEASCMTSQALHLSRERPKGLSFQLRRCTASNLAERGKRLTHHNALREGANRFAPDSVESVVLSLMRTALGGRKAKGPAAAARLGPR